MNSGVVNNVWTKNVNTKYGEKPVTLFSLDSDPGPFNLGFGRHDIKEGDDVTFNDAGEKYGEFQVDKNTLKVVSRGNTVDKSAAPAPAPASGGAPKNTGKGGYNRGNFPLDFTDGQRSILRQHAFTQASEIYRTEFGGELEGSEISSHTAVDQIIELAYKIEKYTSGDDIREEMENL